MIVDIDIIFIFMSSSSVSPDELLCVWITEWLREAKPSTSLHNFDEKSSTYIIKIINNINIIMIIFIIIFVVVISIGVVIIIVITIVAIIASENSLVYLSPQ